MSTLQTQDPQLFALLKGEQKRQKEGMELIPSENYVSEAVLEALGSIFTNKYAEGYPGKRYYGGQEFTDQIEQTAIDRAKKLFKCNFANVQPLSGAPMNIAAYFALMNPGDTILGMDLSHGGHLTHGHPVTMMSKIFRFIRYRMKDIETGEIDFDALRDMAHKEKPKIILMGFTSYPRSLDYKRFKEIADEVGAITMADMSHIGGLIAGGALRNPFEDGIDVVTTTTHKTLRGPRGGMILSQKEEHAKLIDKAVFPGLQGGPHMHNIFAKAICLGEALLPEFKTYASQVLKNSKALADKLMSLGCKLVTNGTENHLMVMDSVTSFGIGGKETEAILDSIHITVNKQSIPDDKNPPLNPSGIRLGSPAVTTRGFKEQDMEKVAEWIFKACKNKDNPSVLHSLKAEVTNFCLKFPVPGIA